MRGQNERSVLPRLDTRADGSQSNIRFANVPIFRGERSAQQLASSSACARRARAICAYGFLCTPEARHGGSRNDTQAANLRELRDQGFRDAVGKILLSRIAADIRERQHCTPLANTSLSRTAPGSVANGVNRPRSPNATSGVYWVSSPHRESVPIQAPRCGPLVRAWMIHCIARRVVSAKTGLGQLVLVARIHPGERYCF